MKFVLKKNASGFWFTLVANNGETVMTSEMLTRKETAIDTMTSINAAFHDAAEETGCIPTDDQT